MKKILVSLTIAAMIVVPSLVLAGTEILSPIELVYQGGYVAGWNHAYTVSAIVMFFIFFLGYFTGRKNKK